MQCCSLWTGRRVIAGCGLLLALGGCVTTEYGGTRPEMSREDYASLQHAIRSDPALRAAFADECTRARAAAPQHVREGTAQLLGVSPAEVDRVFCERETVAIGLGYISYEDFIALTVLPGETSRGDAAAALRVLDALNRASEPPLTPEQFDAQRDRLRADAAFRGDYTRTCEQDVGKDWSSSDHERWAAALGVPLAQALGVYCARLAATIATGRLGYPEWATLAGPYGDATAWQRAVEVLRAGSSDVTQLSP